MAVNVNNSSGVNLWVYVRCAPVSIGVMIWALGLDDFAFSLKISKTLA
ncbi:MAG: hypothetical protein ACYDBZ_08300 [Steroidobacteraceae bacterium]